MGLIIDQQLKELRRLVMKHASHGELTAINGVLVSSTEAPGEPTASSSGTVMALILQGTKRLALGDRLYEYGAGQYLVATVDLPVTGHFSEASHDMPALGFGLVLNTAVVAALLLEAGEGAASTAATRSRQPPAPAGLGVAAASTDLLDAVGRMLALLDRPTDQAILAPMVEREIIWRLLHGPLRETVRQIGLAHSSLTHISKAVHWINEHYEQPLRVAELAHRCGMSTSAFHRNFLAVTAVSPIQFQKQIRLQKARLVLTAAGDDVASASFRVGYRNVSQFSREYRREFGLPPGRDAARLRSGTASASVGA